MAKKVSGKLKREGWTLHRRDRAIVGKSQSIAFCEALEARQMMSSDRVPTARLLSNPINSWSDSYSFKVTYEDDRSVRTNTLDNRDITVTGPNGFSSDARLIGFSGSGNKVIAKYKITSPGGIFDASDNGSYAVLMNKGQVRDSKNQPVPGRSLGFFSVGVEDYPSQASDPSSSNLVNATVNVVDFGATANDTTDDAAAIQAAIDSLRTSFGLPDGQSPIGGTVFIPAGHYTINKQIELPGGVIVRGAGKSTVLSSRNTDSSLAVFQLMSRESHQYTGGSGLENISIDTIAAKGIDVAPSAIGDIIGARFSNLWISSGGAAIDLRGRDVYQTTIRNIVVTNPGSTALALCVSRPTGNAAANSIDNFVIQGKARTGFVREAGLVILVGDFVIDNMRIEDIGTTVTPLQMGDLITAKGLTLNSTADHLPNGVLLDLTASFRVGIDKLQDISPTRRIRLTDTQDAQIETVTMAQGARIDTSTDITGHGHLTIDQLEMINSAGSTTSELAIVADPSRLLIHNYRIFSSRSEIKIDANNSSPSALDILVSSVADETALNVGPLSDLVVKAADFGVVANDNADDTTALQNAINALPRGNGIPSANGTRVGGSVWLPAGIINLSRPITIPSGVWLVGQGTATTLYNTSANPSEAAIVLVPGAASGTSVGAGVIDFNLNTSVVSGIRADASVNNNLVDFHASNLSLHTAGVGIDLRRVHSFHSLIDTVGFYNIGTTAMWVGDDAGFSADNHVVNFFESGSNSPNYIAEKGMFVFEGSTVIQSGCFYNTTSRVTPIYVSGVADVSGLWTEYAGADLPSDKSVVTLENCTHVDFDRLMLMGPQNKLKLRHSTGVTIGGYSIDGYFDLLNPALDVDSVSHVTFNTVTSILDAGMLDDPRVTVGALVSTRNHLYVDTKTALSGTNLLEEVSDWSVQFGNAQGSMSIQQTASGPQMRVEVSYNPGNWINIAIDTHNATAVAGKHGLLSYRIDGPGTALVWNRNFVSEYDSRSMNSLVAAATPGLLSGSDQINIGLPGTVGGVWIISNVSLVAY